MARIPERAGKDPYHRANSLENLLAWEDFDFVCCAYVTVLGRQPDETGQADFLKQIRAGCSKYDLLWHLRRSTEGKAHDPGISGFDRALKRAAWERRPILGLLARLVRKGADRDSFQDRAMRALRNATLLNQRHLELIREQLSGRPVIGGVGAVMPTEALAASLSPALTSTESSVPELAARTPELNHLRKNRMGGGIKVGRAP